MVTYDLEIRNYGPVTDANGVEVVDTLPAGMTFQSATPSQGSCQESGGVVTCALGNMAVDAVATVEIQAYAPTEEGDYNNVATVSSPQGDVYLENNTDQATITVVQPPDLLFIPIVYGE